MKEYVTYYLLAIFTSTFAWSNAQNTIEIINADQIVYNQKQYGEKQVLIGNVKSKHEDRFLYCDSAYYYATENKIEAFSNIHIRQGDTLNLKGEHLIYFGNKHLAEINNQVVFEHHEMILNTENLNYNFNEQKAYFNSETTITQNSKALKSNNGIYYTPLNKFDFYNNVTLENKNERLIADTVYYWLTSENAIFKSNAKIETPNYLISAQNGWYNQKTGKALLTDKVQIIEINDSTTLHADTCYLNNELNQHTAFGNTLAMYPFRDDSLFLSADTIRTLKQNGFNTLRAYNHVIFKNSEIQGQCDSLIYDRQNNQIILTQEPLIWLNEFQISSDSINLHLRNNAIHSADLVQSSFICSLVEDAKYNQISGQNMMVYFEENELHLIDVEGNGESVYYVIDDIDQATLGVNKVICSNMRIHIKNRMIQNIHFYTKPDAVLYPIDLFPTNNYYLKGFKLYSKSELIEKFKSKTQEYYGI